MILRHWLDLSTLFATGTPRHRRRYAREGLAGIPVSAAHQPTIRRRVETLEDRALLAVDYGDAPDTGTGTSPGNYRTLASDNGPSHTIVAGLFLGNSVDGNDGTQQSAAADLDDRFTTGGSDDEDGVLSPLDLQGTVGAQPTITLLVTNTTGSTATLSGWIDYNRNGVFDNATERAQATVSAGLTDARITLTFPTIPPGSAGQTYARFRLGRDAHVENAVGLSPNGEVEDYVFSITTPSDGTVKNTQAFNGSDGSLPINPALLARHITGIGDLDGDGVEDRAVGDEYGQASGRPGAVTIQFMRANGTVKSSREITHNMNGGPSLSSDDRFGSSVTSPGDLDGDGLVDLIVGARRDDHRGINRGAVYVLFLNADGSVKRIVKIASELNGGPTLADSDYFGTSVTSPGDINGDGVADLIVGAKGDDTGGSSRGSIYVLLMKSNGMVKNSRKLANGVNGGPLLTNGAFFGTSLAAVGDINGDGIPDVAVGAYNDGSIANHRGSVFLMRLNANGSAKLSTNITSDTSGMSPLTGLRELGWSVSAPGDLDGDGIRDIAVGTTYNEKIVVLYLNSRDMTPPGVTGIHRHSPANLQTNADRLIFQVNFDEPVQGVDVADFTVEGITTATVTSVRAISGSNQSQYRVTVSGGDLASLNRMIGLNLAGNASIKNAAGYELRRVEPLLDERYFVDNTPSVFQYVQRLVPATTVTSSDTLVFRLNFNESVTGLDASDFVISGTTTARVTSVNVITAPYGETLKYDVTVSGGNLAVFNGWVGLNLSASAVITDLAGNILPRNEPATDETYRVQNAIPDLLSIRRQTPGSGSTNANQLVFRLTFDEPVRRLDVADFLVNGTTTATVSNVRAVGGMNRTQYDVTVSGGNLADFTGTVGLDLAARPTIVNSDGNPLPAVEPAIDEVYTLNQINPQVVSFRRQNPLSSSTNADRLIFRVQFSDGVTGVDASDFAVDGLPAGRIMSVTPVDGSGLSQYDVAIAKGGLAILTGSVGLNFSSSASIADLDSTGHAVVIAEPSIDEVYSVENVTPEAVSFRRKVPSDRLTDADVLEFFVTFTEPMTGVDPSDFVITGGTTASVSRVKPVENSDGRQFRITISGGDLPGFNGMVGLDFSPSATISDLAGNALPVIEPPLDATYLIDNVLPVAVRIQRQPAEARGSLVFRVTFNEPVTGVDVSDFVVDGATTASVSGVNVITRSGNTQFDVTISGGNLANLNGIVGLNLAPARVIRDIASGQSLTGMEPPFDEVSVLRNGRPGAVSFSRQAPAEGSTDASTLVFRATFTETVTGVDRNDFVVTGTTAAITTVSVVGGSNSTQFDVTVSGGDLGQLNSVVGLNFAASPAIADALGNPLLNVEPAVDQTYQIEDQPADYGDAPDTGSGTDRGNYQTLEADNGPRHIIVPGLYLGAGVDASDGTTQNETADADDRFTTGGRDDEDGILDPHDLRGMVFRVPTVTLLATNTTGTDATLTGWIDYNQDGVFEDRYESASAVVSSGTLNGRITLTFPMIPPVLTGNTYARFRLSTDPAGANPTGEASDGEVEDYAFSITARYPYGERTAVEISHNQNGAPLLTDSDYFGTSIAPVGDLNRDGTIDLAVGAVGDDTGGGADSNRGAVHILFMNGDGSVLSSRKIASGLNGGPVLADEDLFGASVAPIGDLDGDGVADLVVGSVWNDAGGEDRGAIYILRMNADGTVKNSTKIASGLNGGPVLANGDGFGYSLGSLGDLDGDGTADLVVGAYADDTGGTNRGAAHVLFMNASGTVKSSLKLASGMNGVPALRDGDAFGSGVASLGDLDGDGIVDLAIGAYSDDSGRVDCGAVHILLLNANGSVKRGTKYFNSSIHGSFGNSLASAGDIDGDGIVNRTDLIVGAYADDTGGPGRGTFYLLNLNSDGSVHSNTRFTFGANWFPQPADEDAFGTAVAVVDLNQDGFTDFIAGAPGKDAGGVDRGAMHVLLQSGMASSEVNLPDGGGSYELLKVGSDLILRAVDGAELFRGSIQTSLGLIIHGSSQSDSVRVDHSWSISVIFNGAGGNDIFDGSLASNSLTLDGGSGADTLMGSIRQDILKGGDGDDLVSGGNDHLHGLFFPNLLDGGAGNDSLIGSTAGDTLLGHAGNDLLTGNGGDDYLDGGTGNDRIEEITDGSVTIIGNQWQSASLGNNTMADVERVVLTGGDGPNLFNAREATIEVSLIGNDGDDTLIGGSTSDTLRGNRGSDVLTGGGGVDVIDGGAGFDTWFESADASFAVFGTQIVSLATGDEAGVSIERIALEGGAGNNRLNAINASVPVLLVGGAGNDTITGGSGDDTLTGGFRGDSTVAGSDGVDSLNGRDGRDTLKNDPADSRTGEVLLGDAFALLPDWLDLI